jgi:hypothetical protein
VRMTVEIFFPKLHQQQKQLKKLLFCTFLPSKSRKARERLSAEGKFCNILKNNCLSN